jgi:hypothetical protein
MGRDSLERLASPSRRGPRMPGTGARRRRGEAEGHSSPRAGSKNGCPSDRRSRRRASAEEEGEAAARLDGGARHSRVPERRISRAPPGSRRHRMWRGAIWVRRSREASASVVSVLIPLANSRFTVPVDAATRTRILALRRSSQSARKSQNAQWWQDRDPSCRRSPRPKLAPVVAASARRIANTLPRPQHDMLIGRYPLDPRRPGYS